MGSVVIHTTIPLTVIYLSSVQLCMYTYDEIEHQGDTLSAIAGNREVDICMAALRFSDFAVVLAEPISNLVW